MPKSKEVYGLRTRKSREWSTVFSKNPIVPLGRGIGKQVLAIISPLKSFALGLGSDADRSLIASFLKDVPAEEQRKWIAGHLLNADFGGPGNAGWNITPLTAHANHRHRTEVERVVEENQRRIHAYFSLLQVQRYASLVVRQVYRVILSGKPGLYAGSASSLHAVIGFQMCSKNASDGSWSPWKPCRPDDLIADFTEEMKKIAEESGSPVPRGLDGLEVKSVVIENIHAS